MAKEKNFHYFVEGQDEQKLLSTLKTDMNLIQAGRIQVYNVVEKQIKKAYLLALKKPTTVVFVFDTDTGKIDTLKNKIEIIQKKKCSIDIPQPQCYNPPKKNMESNRGIIMLYYQFSELNRDDDR